MPAHVSPSTPRPAPVEPKTPELGADSLPAGVIAANAIKDSIANEFHLSNAQYFLLPSIFMVGLLVASPVFAQLTRTTSALSLIGTLHSSPIPSTRRYHLHAAVVVGRPSIRTDSDSTRPCFARRRGPHRVDRGRARLRRGAGLLCPHSIPHDGGGGRGVLLQASSQPACLWFCRVARVPALSCVSLCYISHHHTDLEARPMLTAWPPRSSTTWHPLAPRARGSPSFSCAFRPASRWATSQAVCYSRSLGRGVCLS